MTHWVLAGAGGAPASRQQHGLHLLNQVMSPAGLQAVASGAVCPATEFVVGCWEDRAPGTFTWRPTSVSCQRSALPCFKEQKESVGILMVGDSVDLRMLEALCTQAKGQFEADIGGPQYYGDLHVCQLSKLYIMHVFVPGVRKDCQQAARSVLQEVTDTLLPSMAGAGDPGLPREHTKHAANS